MNNSLNNTKSLIILGLFIMIGLIGAGYLVGKGVIEFSTARSVTVKGLAERDVTSDLAVFSIGFVSSNDDLIKTQEKIEKDKQQVMAFLLEQGLTPEEIQSDSLRVVDLLAREYGEQKVASPRYIINAALSVRTKKVDIGRKINESIGQLVKAGIVLGENKEPQYFFTGLNSIKPELIAEATKNARKSAEQFAADSNSKVGSIRWADQGAISITDANGDGYSSDRSILKKVRIVSTVVYNLE